MSLAIEIDNVTGVLLADGQWWYVLEDSFALDAYEYVWAAGGHAGYPDVLHSGGEGGITSTGFQFKGRTGSGKPTYHLSGPLTAILAVRQG